MTIENLNSQLTAELKSYIRRRGYVDTGQLVNSIKFNARQKPDGTLDMKLNAEDYIQYLEQGELLNNFFATKKTLDIITKYEADRISREVIIELDK